MIKEHSILNSIGIPKNVEFLRSEINKQKNKIQLTGLVGSSFALQSSLTISDSEFPQIFILESKESALYFSSSMVYGNFKGDFVTEQSDCNPLGIYGTLKYTGELILKAYHRVFDIPYTIIRPSALYGERCVSRRVGQIFIENAVQGHDVTVAGDGSDRLDFTYIEDLIRGLILTIEKKEAINQTFNLTYGESRTIGEMADIIKENFNNVNINYIPKDSLTPNRGTLSVDKAKDLLGYNPTNSLDIGYPKYISWYKDFWKKSKLS